MPEQPAPQPGPPPGPVPGEQPPGGTQPPGDWWGDAPASASAIPGQPPMGPAPMEMPTGPARTDPKAIWGLVLSIVGLLVCGVVLQPIAIVLGFLSRKSIRESYGALKGDGLAIAAIVIGIIGFILSVIVLVTVLSDPDFLDQIDNG